MGQRQGHGHCSLSTDKDSTTAHLHLICMTTSASTRDTMKDNFQNFLCVTNDTAGAHSSGHKTSWCQFWFILSLKDE